ncbi:MAG: hypothetical protein RMY16_08430 [Nostoc sp. DedQUE12b]|uniref:hypothetical protein n=1 Tax=Nostoc sp. DedQUE12b TaxID=3075398 RepID=UPI002AD3FA16|nr:hypothetical protein [Nostoc sp. DedQUE12b]MDZ8085608.1 hypothetical protein [Nostoc sp. DedQUE12b]
MKHNSDVPGQLTLLTVAPTVETRTTVHDPYWDELETAPEHPEPETRWNPAHFGEVPHKVSDNGQLTIFFDECDEPPDPDDYLNRDDYEQAWERWESTVREQDTQASVLFSEDSENIAGGRLPFVREHDTHISAPEHSILGEPCPPAPEHTHWVEKYWVKRGNSKHNYYRYCWMSGRKIHHCHISGGSTASPLAIQRRGVVESAIADGKLPFEIKDLIRGWKNELPTMPKVQRNNTNL